MHHESFIAVGKVFQGRYSVQEVLSTGGFAVVYRAEQLATGQTVAIKCIRRFGPTPADDEKRLSRFRREIRLCAQLHHPNIVRLLDSGSMDGSMYAVFEYLPGKNLAQLLADEGRLAPLEAGYLMGQVLDALSCAHDAGIIHRDIKPANIMIVPTGARRNAMVLDFGIGGVLRDVFGCDEKTLTHTFDRLGTPAYASPEQLRGRVLTPRTDIYSWGLVFLECLTGRRAIEGATIGEIMHHQLDDAPVPIPRALMGHALEELLRVSTAKNDTHRRLGTRELLARLDACPLTTIDLASEAGAAAQTPEEHATLGVAASQATGPAPPRPEVTTANLIGQHERREVTMVSCAVNVLADDDDTQVDLEEHEERLAEEVASCRELAAPLGGHPMRSVDHRVLLCFGYPRASGDDARRAIHAALTLARDFTARNARRARGLRSEVQIGVHTGLVLVRQDARATAPASFSGSAIRMVTHIDEHAPSNGVVISQSTCSLVRSQFAVSPRGHVSVPGQPEPIGIFQVAEASAEPVMSQSGGDASVPLIGRDREMQLLRRHARMASEGHGQSVLVTGDPGMGKSRLVTELGRELRSDAWCLLYGRCLPESRHGALQPVVELLRRHFALGPDLDDAERQRRLERLCDAHGLERAAAMPLLAPLMNVRLAGSHAQLAPPQQRQMLLRVLLSLFCDMAARQPVALAIEDMHWADAGTMELARLLVEEASTVAMLVVFTARPAAGGALDPTATIKLDRLDEHASLDLIQRCAGGKPLPDSVLGELLRRTDGVPLFIEEMVHHVLGSGVVVESGERHHLQGRPSDIQLPVSLRELLLARRSELSEEAGAALQLGAVLGREFLSEELAAAGSYDGDTLRRLIDALVDSGLLYRRRRSIGEILGFKHALVHEAVYDAIPRQLRAMHHRQVMRMIEARSPGVADERPEILARHHAGAGQIADAVTYARRAALGAISRAASDEAIGHAEQAITWLQRLADQKQRAELELGFHGIIASAMFATRGHGSREAGVLARRSLKLISLVGNSPRALDALWGLWIHYIARAELMFALPLAENYLDRAELLGDERARCIGAAMLARTLTSMGRPAEAHAAASRSIAHYQPEARQHYLATMGYDVQTGNFGLRAMCAWLLGRTSEAAVDAAASLELARASRHPATLCMALSIVAEMQLWNGDLAAAERTTRELLDIAGRGGLDIWMHIGALGAATAARDATRLRAALDRLAQANLRLGAPCWHAFVAEIEAAAGRQEQAHAAIATAQDLAERSGEGYFLPEIHRRHGLLLATQPGGAGQAETSLRRAIAIAEKQGARLPGFLATAALCRLQQRERRVDAASVAALAALGEGIGKDMGSPAIAAARAVLVELGAGSVSAHRHRS
jgi:TOMM system kinase/cyclase fusion protein